ncbi:putative glycolipid-binding domain-containing protein [Pontibacillus yanchengensis]|nr:putative glycolipid-binding domain-containing protein [Pontibacillus yanchengensis]
MSQRIIWQNKETAGCEYVHIIEDDESIIAKGTVLFVEKGQPYQVNYEIEVDQHWITKGVRIQLNEAYKELNLQTNNKGKWCLNGNRVKDMDGTIDVDLSVTPLSNTLPIKRCTWREGETKTFQMLYIDIPSFDLKKLKQTYTYIGRDNNQRTFRYTCQDYKTTISVDEDGFVIEYPNLFTRKANLVRE